MDTILDHNKLIETFELLQEIHSTEEITLIELAEELNIKKTELFKYIKSNSPDINYYFKNIKEIRTSFNKILKFSEPFEIQKEIETKILVITKIFIK